MLFSVSFIRYFHRFVGVEICIKRYLSIQMNGFVAKFYDFIACRKPCFFCRITIHYFAKNRTVKANACYQNKRKRNRHNKIKNWPCSHDRSPLQYRFVVKSPVILAGLIFAFHHTGASKGQQL